MTKMEKKNVSYGLKDSFYVYLKEMGFLVKLRGKLQVCMTWSTGKAEVGYALIGNHIKLQTREEEKVELSGL